MLRSRRLCWNIRRSSVAAVHVPLYEQEFNGLMYRVVRVSEHAALETFTASSARELYIVLVVKYKES